MQLKFFRQDRYDFYENDLNRLEKKVNEWLKAIGNIDILGAVLHDSDTYFLFAIWYREVK